MMCDRVEQLTYTMDTCIISTYDIVQLYSLNLRVWYLKNENEFSSQMINFINSILDTSIFFSLGLIV
jgi:hypothetical protein